MDKDVLNKVIQERSKMQIELGNKNTSAKIRLKNVLSKMILDIATDIHAHIAKHGFKTKSNDTKLSLPTEKAFEEICESHFEAVKALNLPLYLTHAFANFKHGQVTVRVSGTCEVSRLIFPNTANNENPKLDSSTPPITLEETVYNSFTDTAIMPELNCKLTLVDVRMANERVSEIESMISDLEAEKRKLESLTRFLN